MLRDAFDVLGIAPTFDLPAARLQSAYLAMSARLHPDAAAQHPSNVGNEDEVERRAAELNAAKRLLDDPESRADVLLRRLGGPSKEADKSLPPEFLAEMLETREQIEAAIVSAQPGAIDGWIDWASARRREHMSRVRTLFQSVLPTAPDLAGGASGQYASTDAGVLKRIRAELNMWRYIERLLEQLESSQP